ncbi:unnamed protein product [Schistosoma curassoni]|uniref:CPBP family intramembrane metalloprotease n=1 Tax=Schistosoma curassoni TaxID=6186 RepID=A0A183KHK5_9TREM|nr:unnamed protein product [Schistosoma curassoni]
MMFFKLIGKLFFTSIIMISFTMRFFTIDVMSFYIHMLVTI